MKFVFLFIFTLSLSLAKSQSDDCNTATPIALSGSTCITGSTSGVTTTNYSSHPCYPTGQEMYVVFYTFVADNPNVTIEVTGTGANPTAQVGMTVSTSDCAAGLWED